MHILVAPDSYKGSLSAVQVGETIKSALLKEMPQASVDVVPMADGGEGTVDSFVYAVGGRRVYVAITGPTGKKMRTYYGVLNDGKTVVIEMAAVVGLPLVPKGQRNPDQLTTVGVGECIRHALDQGFRHFIIGLGGSATNDGGIGMLQALGVQFYDKEQKRLPPNTSSLARVYAVDYRTLDSRIKGSKIQVASDVDNPLCGPEGASYVFGPQKGATPEQMAALDKGLANYAQCIEKHLGATYQHTSGAGAAGGLGFAFLTIGGVIQSGASLVTKATHFENKLRRADWLITGEGKTDGQTLHGKLPYYVAKLAKKHGVPTILLSGALGGDLDPLYDVFDSMHAIQDHPMTVEESMERTEYLLFHKARNIARLLRKG